MVAHWSHYTHQYGRGFESCPILKGFFYRKQVSLIRNTEQTDFYYDINFDMISHPMAKPSDLEQTAKAEGQA